MSTLIIIFIFLQDSALASETKGALETLKDISPVAYVMSILLGSMLIYVNRLYQNEKKKNSELYELRIKEFKEFSKDQIELQKDVMSLVRQAASTFNVTAEDNKAKLEELNKIMVHTEHLIENIHQKINQ